MKKAVTRKRFRRPACSTVGQPRLIGQICEATYQSGTMCFDFNPCKYSFPKITLELTQNSRKGTILKRSSVIQSAACPATDMFTLEVSRKKC